MKHKSTITVFAAALALVACGGSNDAPKGQVVASVDGQEITLSELNAELLASNQGNKVEDKKVTQAVLERLIARKLLVAQAKSASLDKGSDFIIARQRSEENELAGLAQRQMIGRIKPPTREEAQQYIKSHPQTFAGRKMMTLEQIRFQQPANANDVKFIESAKSLEDAEARLKQNAIKYERGPVVFDTTSVAPEMAARIDKLAVGELFVVANGKLVLVSQIKEKRPAAIPADLALSYAGQLIQQERSKKAIEGQVAELRKKAKVTYQSGYGPGKSPK